MRGRTFHNSYVISDEMQNSSPHQMKTLATRIGHNSKLVILGDIEQSDLLENKQDSKLNGLNDLIQRLKEKPSKLISSVTLNTEDIERSSLTKEVLKLYNNFLINPILLDLDSLYKHILHLHHNQNQILMQYLY